VGVVGVVALEGTCGLAAEITQLQRTMAAWGLHLGIADDVPILTTDTEPETSGSAATNHRRQPKDTSIDETH